MGGKNNGKKTGKRYSSGGKKNLSLREYVNEKHFSNGKPPNMGGITGDEKPKLPMYQEN